MSLRRTWRRIKPISLTFTEQACQQLKATRLNYAFLQTSLSEAPAKRALQVIRNSARKHNDPVLSQVASRMASTVAMGSKFGEDVFAKIKEPGRDGQFAADGEVGL